MNIPVFDIVCIAFVALLIVPVIIAGICVGVEWCCLQIGNLVYKIEKNRIQKGLEDGSVIEIDGKYI